MSRTAHTKKITKLNTKLFFLLPLRKINPAMIVKAKTTKSGKKRNNLKQKKSKESQREEIEFNQICFSTQTLIVLFSKQTLLQPPHSLPLYTPPPFVFSSPV